MLECQDLADHVKEGDIIQVDLDNQKITADGKTYAIPAIPEKPVPHHYGWWSGKKAL